MNKFNYNETYLNESFFDDIEDDITDNNIIGKDIYNITLHNIIKVKNDEDILKLRINQKVYNKYGNFIEYKTNPDKISQINLSNYDLTTCVGMFANNTKLTNIDLSLLDLSNVDNISNMFYDCNNLESISFPEDNKISILGNTFNSCSSLKHIDLSNIKLPIKNTYGLFKGCHNLQDIDVSMLNTINIQDMSNMFAWCLSLKTLDLSNFRTDHAITMSSMFESCMELTELDLSSFDLSNCINMARMFMNCQNLTTLDIRNFKPINPILGGWDNIFYNCKSLKYITCSKEFKKFIMDNKKTMAFKCTHVKWNYI